jgi:3-oxoacid CoA-transferase subunit B
MHVVHDIVTELAWIKVTPEGLLLTEVAEGVSPSEVQERTEARLIFANHISTMTVN